MLRNNKNFLNRVLLINQKIFTGNKNYNFKIKSLIGFKSTNKFIFNLYYNLIFIKKALKFIESILDNRGVIYFIGSSELINSKIKKKHNNVFFFSDLKSLGILSNLRNNFLQPKKLPDVIILCSKKFNTDLLSEANRLNIPTIVLLSSDMKFDNITFPIFTNFSNSFYLFYFNLLLNVIFFSGLREKNKVSRIIKKNVKK
jgi:ribosomal protein S2